MRPGAPFAPVCVWQPLQSPDVCGQLPVADASRWEATEGHFRASDGVKASYGGSLPSDGNAGASAGDSLASDGSFLA